MNKLNSAQEYDEARSQVLKEIERTAMRKVRTSFLFHTTGLSILITVTQLLMDDLTMPLIVSWIGLSINFNLLKLRFQSQRVACVTNNHLMELTELKRK